VAIVRNRTKDVGLGALVSVTSGGAPLATKQLKVGPRGRVVLQIPVTLTQLGTTQLTVTVTPASPIETTLKNNTRGLAVEATEFKVQESATLAQSFAGYGGQFNHHVYAAISRAAGVTDDNAKDMERKMRELQPQFSRVFFNNTAFTDPDRMQSFVRTVQLAQSTGTTGSHRNCRHRPRSLRRRRRASAAAPPAFPRSPRPRRAPARRSTSRGRVGR